MWTQNNERVLTPAVGVARVRECVHDNLIAKYIPHFLTNFEQDSWFSKLKYLDINEAGLVLAQKT